MLSRDLYPSSELSILDDLAHLFDKWINHLRDKSLYDTYTADDFVTDGFYPYYFSQNPRILFIGREALGMSGMDYLESLYKAYKNNSVAQTSLDGHRFHTTMFYLAYGLLNGFPAYQTVPYASELAKTFGTGHGMSFAFMNLSKFSNDSDSSWVLNNELATNFLENSKDDKINFHLEEINILQPDIIITSNLNEVHLLSYLGELKEVDLSDSNVWVYELSSHNRSIPILETWHFSNWSKQQDTEVYEPVLRKARQYLNKE